MVFRRLTEGYRALDEDVLRYYTKLGSKISDKHLSKYLFGVWGLGMVFFVSANRGLSKHFSIDSHVISWPYAIGVSGIDLAHNVFFSFDRNKEEVYSEAVALNRGSQSYIFLGKLVRLPLITTGAGLIVKGLYDLTMSFVHGEPLDVSTIISFQLGAAFISHASSIYLKDQDPKSLQRKSLFEKSLDYFKDRASDLIPVPQITHPTFNYDTLEDKV